MIGREIVHIYCDESCHLEADGKKAMVLGALSCPRKCVSSVSRRLMEIKETYALAPRFEVKWTKVSPGKLDFYSAFLETFFDIPELSFRALVIPDKSILRHEVHDQTHDDWYFKMYFLMLRPVVKSSHEYRIFLDIKDTRGREKLSKLREVLSNNMYDFSQSTIQYLQTINSFESGLMQLADMLIGAVSYENRNESGSAAKQNLVALMKRRASLTLKCTTSPSREKVNILCWEPTPGGK